MKIEDYIAEARNGYEMYKASLKELENAYHLRLDEKVLNELKETNRSHLYIPKINAKAKRMADALGDTYFNNDKFAKLDTYINSDQETIDKWQEAIDHYTEMIRLYKIFNPIFQRVPYQGTAIAKVFWSGDLAQIEDCDINKVWTDPRANTAEDIRYIVDNIYLTKDDIRSNQKAGIYKKNIKVDEIFHESVPCERFELQDVYLKQSDGTWELTTVYEDTFILREKVKLADGQPFIFGYMLPQQKIQDEDDTFVAVYGEPPLASILPLQNEMNITRNQQVDAMNAHLKPKIVLPRTSGVTRADIDTVGKPIFISNPAQMQIMPLPNMGATQANIELSEQEMSEVSGVSAQQNGIAPNRKETATQASIMSNEGSVRMQGYIRTFNETFFEPIFERLAMLVWKYADAEFFAGIQRGEVPSFKVSLNTGIGALNKEVQKQSLLQAHQMVAGQLQQAMGLQDIESARKYFKAGEKIVREVMPLYGIKNIDEFLGEEDDGNGTNVPTDTIGEVNQSSINGAIV